MYRRMRKNLCRGRADRVRRQCSNANEVLMGASEEQGNELGEEEEEDWNWWHTSSLRAALHDVELRAGGMGGEEWSNAVAHLISDAVQSNIEKGRNGERNRRPGGGRLCDPERKCFCLCLFPTSLTFDDDAMAEMESEARGVQWEQRRLCCHGQRRGKRTVKLKGDETCLLGYRTESEIPCLRVSYSLELAPDETEEVEEALRALLIANCNSVGAVECLIVSPCIIPMQSKDLIDVTVSVEPLKEDLVDTFFETGLLCIPHAVSPLFLDYCRIEANARIAWADEKLRNRKINIGIDTFTYKEICSRSTGRFDLLVDMTSDSSTSLVRLSREAIWMPLIYKLLGTSVLCEVSIVYSRPGATTQEWHSDGPHIGRGADWNGTGQSRPYALCVFLPLIDLHRHQVGYTEFWLESHKYPSLIGFGGAVPLLDVGIDGIVSAGDAIIYDYRLIHRGVRNLSDVERPILQFLYHQPSYTETRNYGKSSVL